MAKVVKDGSVTVKVVVPFIVTAEKADMKNVFAAAKLAVAEATKSIPPKRLVIENGKLSFPQAE